MPSFCHDVVATTAINHGVDGTAPVLRRRARYDILPAATELYTQSLIHDLVGDT